MAVEPLGTTYDIIAVGLTSSGGNFGMVRYQADGSLDSAFDAKVGSPFVGETFDPSQVALMPGGAIAVGGYTYTGNSSDGDLSVACFNPDGSLDTSFDAGATGGTVNPGGAWVGLDACDNDPCGMAVDTQGNIVLAGTANVTDGSGVYEFALARFTSGGSPDDSFGSGGKVLENFGDGSNHATCLALQPDGGIVVAGYSDSFLGIGGQSGLDLLRFTSSGGLDTTFNSGGIITQTINMGLVSSVAVQADGKILIGGAFGLETDFGIARFDTDGSLDASSMAARPPAPAAAASTA